MKKLALLLVFAASLSCFGQLAGPTVYVEPQQGFETYLSAAISKKNVPVDVVTDQTTSGVTSKAANGGHFKTGQRKWPGTRLFYSVASWGGKSVFVRQLRGPHLST
jgi:hypothetical protein